MVLGQILRTLIRRWYLVAIGLLFTAGLAYYATTLTPPTYSANGTVLLLPSKDQLSQGGGNPFLLLGDLDSPASIVIARLSSDTEAARIADIAPTAQYSVGFDDSLRGPAVFVSVTDRSPDSALAAMQKLMTEVPRELSALQVERNVPASATIGSMTLVADTRASESTSGTQRSGIAGLGVGLVLTAIVVFAADGLLQRRSARRRAEGGDDPDYDAEDPGDGDPATEPGTLAGPEEVADATETVRADSEPTSPISPREAKNARPVPGGQVPRAMRPRVRSRRAE